MVFLFALLVVSGVLAFVYCIRSASPDSAPKGLPLPGGRPLHVEIDSEYYQQFDRRWSREKLGPSEGLLAHYGCTVCATAMALTSKEIDIDPSGLNESLRENNGFTESGLLIWKGIEAVTGDRFSVDVINKPTYNVIDDQLAKGNPVIAKVFYNNEIWHWVLIAGKSGTEYLMHDPLGNQPFESMKEYPHGIFAVRYLVEK